MQSSGYHHCWWEGPVAYGPGKDRQGGHKVGEEKLPEISRLFQRHKLTFPYVITTESNPAISNYQ